MKTPTFICFLAITAAALDAAVTEIHVTDFGARPDDGVNDLVPLRLAVAAAVKRGDCNLVMPPGRYLMADDEAIKLQNKAMSGEMGNPEKAIFNRDFKYVTALDFSGAKNINVVAGGAELLCDGWMEPVSLQCCEGVTINGLAIDYRRPPNSSGVITAVGDGTVDVRFADWCPVTAQMPFLRLMVFDDNASSYCGGSYSSGGQEEIGSNTIRFRFRNEHCRVGRSLVAFHSFHFRPAILLYRAKNTVLNDVSIHAQPGMGIVGHMAENLVMNRLRIVPMAGRHVPCNTDATHFVSCRGILRFNRCEFAGQGDDATNVHVFYTDILAKGPDHTATLEIGRRFETHSVKRDFPRVGDTLAIVDRKSLRETGSIKVEAVTLSDKDYSYQIRYRGELPEDFGNYTVANVSASAALEFLNCKVRSHRARSVLVKTRKVRIEGCSFENTTGTCIHIGAEGDWMEGVGSADVIIRNNTITHCGLGGEGDGTLEGASGIAIQVKAQDRNVPGIHRRILVENNTIRGGHHAIAIRGAEDVTVRGNTFVDIQGAPVTVGASDRVWSYGNRGADDIKVGTEPALPRKDRLDVAISSRKPTTIRGGAMLRPQFRSPCRCSVFMDLLAESPERGRARALLCFAPCRQPTAHAQP